LVDGWAIKRMSDIQIASLSVFLDIIRSTLHFLSRI
jgi:hypothetical protein